MPTVGSLKVWGAEVLTHGDLNGNFSEVKTKVNTYGAWLDQSQTFTAKQTINPTSGVALEITDGGITVVDGGITVTAGTSALQAVTATTVTASGALAAGDTTITGTISASGNATLSADVSVGGDLTMTAGQAVAKRVDDGNSGTAKTIDWSAGNCHKLTLTGNCTLTLSNPVVGASYVLELLQDGSGSKTVTWPATVKWGVDGSAPTLTTTANRKDVIVMFFNGTNYLAAVMGVAYADTV